MVSATDLILSHWHNALMSFTICLFSCRLKNDIIPIQLFALTSSFCLSSKGLSVAFQIRDPKCNLDNFLLNSNSGRFQLSLFGSRHSGMPVFFLILFFSCLAIRVYISATSHSLLFLSLFFFFRLVIGCHVWFFFSSPVSFVKVKQTKKEKRKEKCSSKFLYARAGAYAVCVCVCV